MRAADQTVGRPPGTRSAAPRRVVLAGAAI
jgi:hypothetical protein